MKSNVNAVVNAITCLTEYLIQICCQKLKCPTQNALKRGEMAGETFKTVLRTDFQKNSIIKLSLASKYGSKTILCGSIEKHRNRAWADTQRELLSWRIAACVLFSIWNWLRQNEHNCELGMDENGKIRTGSTKCI